MADTKDRITITIDPNLLKRLKKVAEVREQSVSAVIERIARQEIDAEEEFVRDMESPAMRAIMTAMTKTPGVMEGIAKLIGQNMSKEEFEQMRDGLNRQKELGKQRAVERKKQQSGKVSPA